MGVRRIVFGLFLSILFWAGVGCAKTAETVLEELMTAFKGRAWVDVCEETFDETESFYEEPSILTVPVEWESKINLPHKRKPVSDPPEETTLPPEEPSEEPSEETTEGCMLLEANCPENTPYVNATTCQCVTCLSDANCGDCESCQNNQCVSSLEENQVCCDKTPQTGNACCGTQGYTQTEKECCNETLYDLCDSTKGFHRDTTTCSCSCPEGQTEIGSMCCPTCNTPKKVTVGEDESCSCSCPEGQTEIGNTCCSTCDAPKKVTVDENESCSCSCPEGQTEVGSTCCPTCDAPKKVTVDENESCSCSCPEGQTEIGSMCCPTCDAPKKVTVDENESCSCSCPEGQTEIGNTCCPTCDVPKKATVDENESCSCSCSEGQTEIRNTCCPTCDAPKKVTVDENESCSCSCPEGQTEIGNTCCPTCDAPKKVTVDANNNCSCSCPEGQGLWEDTCVECDTNHVTCTTPKRSIPTLSNGECTCACPNTGYWQTDDKGNCVCTACALDEEGRPYCPGSEP